MCESTFTTTKQVKPENRNRNETVDDSLRLATTNTGIDKTYDRLKEASTTRIALTEICNKLLFAIG